MRHSPSIRLANAKRARDAAWDYEGDGETRHKCCEDVEAAKEEVRLARKAVERAENADPYA